MGPDPENRVGDQDTGSPGRPVCSGLQVAGAAACKTSMSVRSAGSASRVWRGVHIRREHIIYLEQFLR